MVNYRIVNYCRLCKKRYVIDKGQPKHYYCDECREKHESLKFKDEKKEEKKD